MKKQFTKKMGLSKITVQRLEMKELDRDDQKEVRGGEGDPPNLVTLTPVFC